MEVLNIDEVHDLTRVPVPTLRYWRHKGTGPKSFKIGRRVVYKRADVEAWLELQYAGGAA